MAYMEKKNIKEWNIELPSNTESPVKVVNHKSLLLQIHIVMGLEMLEKSMV